MIRVLTVSLTSIALALQLAFTAFLSTISRPIYDGFTMIEDAPPDVTFEIPGWLLRWLIFSHAFGPIVYAAGWAERPPVFVAVETQG
jgi:hypothetical protein